MKSIAFTISPPHPILSPNARPHWSAKAAKVRAYRHAAMVLATSASRGANPRWTAATVQLTAYVKDRRRRDADNYLASCKPLFDGLKDAGVIADDSGLTHLPLVWRVDKDRQRLEVMVAMQDAKP